MKIAWITDSAPLLAPDFIEKHNVHVLPLNIVFPDATYRDGVDLSLIEFYEKLRTASEHPKSSQPNLGEHIELYEKLKAEGYDYAIAIHVSSAQSGTFASATLAANDAGFTTYPFDSKIGSYPMQKMIELGQQLAAEGKSPEEILAALQDLRTRAELTFVPASLSNLHKSGRVSGTAMFLSNLLNIKAVIAYNDEGVCEVVEKVRSDKRAKQRILNQLDAAIAKSGVDEAVIIHCNNEDAANAWKQELEAKYPNISFLTTELTAIVGLHAGEGTLGLTWIRN